MGEKYMRQEVDPGPLSYLLPEGGKMYKRPDIPKVQFKKDKINYSMTDFRLLHPLGLEAFKICLGAMIGIQDATECRIAIGTDMDDDTIDIIIDIVTGFEYEARKGGRNGFYCCSSPVTGSEVEESEDGNKVLVFKFYEQFSKSVYEYSHMHKGGKITLAEIIMYAAQRM